MPNYSANQPTLASITGALSLLATVPANSGRKAIIVQNQSAGDVVVVGDYGTAGSDLWTYILTGVGGGLQGAELPQELRQYGGAVSVYGASGARVAVVGV